MNTRPCFCVAHLPPELTDRFLDHIRAFDRENPGCHFELAINAPGAEFAEAFDTVRRAAERLGLPIFGAVKEP